MIKVFVSLVAACLALAAQAQTQFPPFSPRPITIVLAFPPGASADGLMRLVTQKITDQTGQSFVIRNTPGGSGTVAAATVKRAPPDGLTLLQATLTTMATNQRLADEPQYDLVKDFKAVTKLWSLPLLAIVPTSGGVKSMRELVELARRKPGGASYSSTGVHTVPHFLGALLAVESGAPMFHVPYSGASTAIVDLVAGRLDLYFVSYAAVVSQVEAGHLRALAVADSAPAVVAVAPATVVAFSAWLMDLSMVFPVEDSPSPPLLPPHAAATSDSPTTAPDHRRSEPLRRCMHTSFRDHRGLPAIGSTYGGCRVT